MANLSIKSKLLVMLLGVSLGSIALVASLNYWESHKAMRNAVIDHLTSVRASRARAIERYLNTVKEELEVLAAAPSVGPMLIQLGSAYREIEDTELDPAQLGELEAYYRDQYLPELDAVVEGTPELKSVFPEANGARVLQYWYLARNPFPPGNHLQLDDPDDGSTYSAVHAQVHPMLRRIANGFGYYDLFLIELTTGVIVYTNAKEVDFGTSLVSGPYAQTNLGRLFREIQRNPDRGAARIVDFEHYRPSYNAPALFVASPVFVDGRPVGVVAAQESTAELDDVITGGRQWERDGLGKTGETVLIGQDFTMRSPSRFLIEDPEGYAADLREMGASEQTIDQILHHKTPILEQEARTVAAEQGLRGQTGAGVIVDYRGQEILGSWAPLTVGDLHWAIVGKMDLSEAFEPIYQLARNTLVQTVIILGAITLLVMGLAASFVRPVNDLISRVKRFGAGDVNVDFDGETGDEIGDLSRSFKDLVESARTQTRLIEAVSKENERLLQNILPQRFARQVQQGTEEVTETVPDVSVVFVEVRGLAELTRSRSAGETVEVLRRFLSAADATAAEHKAERIKTMGDTYMAAVGLSAPLLDHMQRAVEFARDLKRAVALASQELDAGLELIVGIASGPVITNVRHDKEVVFQLWGEAVIRADDARDRAEPGQIVVGDEIRTALQSRYRFERLAGEDPHLLWVLQAG